MREERVFFSEEKKQKTFVSPQLQLGRPWPGSCRRRRDKSLLVLFFRKERFLPSACRNLIVRRDASLRGDTSYGGFAEPRGLF
jgi:hypothetical protein